MKQGRKEVIRRREGEVEEDGAYCGGVCVLREQVLNAIENTRRIRTKRTKKEQDKK